jgi:hypothetical protein
MGVMLGVMEISEAKYHQAKFKEHGIEIELMSNTETCTRGCKVTVEMWGSDKDLEFFQQYFKADYFKNLGDHQINFKALEATYDPNQPETICQACGDTFSTSLSECPSCGLVY